MIKIIEKSACSEDEAIRLALEEAGLERDDVSLEIVSRAKSGFLGIGSKPAIIKISFEVPDEPAVKPDPVAAPKAEKASVSPERSAQDKSKNPNAGNKKSKPAKADPAAKAGKENPVREKKPVDPNEPEEFKRIRAFLDGLLMNMGLDADIDISADENSIDVILSGDSMGSVIGRRGETLDAIQHLTNYSVNRGSEKHRHINIDAENYRSKREESLVKLAEKMAEKAIKYKRSMALEPMNSYERHIIHTALQDYKGVTTASTGSEPNRRVVVNYEKPEQPQHSNKPKAREWS